MEFVCRDLGWGLGMVWYFVCDQGERGKGGEGGSGVIV